MYQIDTSVARVALLPLLYLQGVMKAAGSLQNFSSELKLHENKCAKHSNLATTAIFTAGQSLQSSHKYSEQPQPFPSTFPRYRFHSDYTIVLEGGA